MRAYATELNATKAALRAGYSEKTAYAIGAENLKKLEIRQAISFRLEQAADKLEISPERTLLELAIVAYSNHQHYTLDDQFNLVLAEGAPPFAMRAVSGVTHKVSTRTTLDGEVETDHRVEYKLWNKNDAIKQLMSHLGLLTLKVEHSGTVEHTHTYVERLTSAKERALAAKRQGLSLAS